MSLSKIVCYITGGASGLGRATAIRIAKNGGKVVIADLAGSSGETVARQIGSDVAFFHPTDIVNTIDIQHGVQLAKERFGEINVLVNCAATILARRMIDQNGKAHPIEDFTRIVGVNLIGTFNVVRILSEHMAQNTPNENGERGVIINTSSISAFEGHIDQSAYAASKMGMVAMTIPIARDLASYGIRVNCISPGLFKTPLWNVVSIPEDIQDKFAKLVPFPSRLGDPDAFAHLVEAIINNCMINGENIRIDGALLQG